MIYDTVLSDLDYEATLNLIKSDEEESIEVYDVQIEFFSDNEAYRHYLDFKLYVK